MDQLLASFPSTCLVARLVEMVVLLMVSQLKGIMNLLFFFMVSSGSSSLASSFSGRFGLLGGSCFGSDAEGKVFHCSFSPIDLGVEGS